MHSNGQNIFETANKQNDLIPTTSSDLGLIHVMKQENKILLWNEEKSSTNLTAGNEQELKVNLQQLLPPLSLSLWMNGSEYACVYTPISTCKPKINV